MINSIRENKLMPVFYHQDAETCLSVLKTCYEAGIRIFEFTNRGVSAFNTFCILKEKIWTDFPGMRLGIGTIFSIGDAEKFIQAGAEFIVAPVVQAEVGAYCHSTNVLWIPGCMTPTEIHQARIARARLVKLFPGDALGPSFLKAVKPVFPDLCFMPTGGVNTEKENLDGWFEAEIVAVGLGSQLFTKKILDEKDWEKLSLQIMQTFSYIGNSTNHDQ
jgi:2-dehydro-3-deoxyphosphogluconate aldolase/(4S)-4-hydroxy-2-oxoglutarate aldolase